MSHSKRNTSRPVFTSHERALAKSNWAASSARLSRDSYLPFGSCALCLGTAVEPVACQRGDIFCRECALSNILAQKKELRRARKIHRKTEDEISRAKAFEEEEVCRRAVRDFELKQAGLESVHKAARDDASRTCLSKPSSGLALAFPAKRKLSLDNDEGSRMTESDRVKARREIDTERAAKPTLPSFWTPSLTPDVQDSKRKHTSSKNKARSPICPASSDKEPHAILAQRLQAIQFSHAVNNSTLNNPKICPACLKPLSDSASPVMAQPCGHVLCIGCVTKFLIPSFSQPIDADVQVPVMCYVCDTPTSSDGCKTRSCSCPLPHGLVALRSEGTGFSARGASTVCKSGIAFQC